MNKDGEQLKVGSLFSGIGGIELGLERTGGFRTIWNCEIEPYPSAILAERWPQVPNLGDITKVDWRQVERPDILCGGFPCQDISNAGRRAGIGGKKSGLWKCYLEAIRELRPRIVLAENVSALLNRGLETVLIDLAEVGYDVEWDCVPACSVGAPHRRDRIFIIAYPAGQRLHLDIQTIRCHIEKSQTSGKMANDSGLGRLDLRTEIDPSEGREQTFSTASSGGFEVPDGRREGLERDNNNQEPSKGKGLSSRQGFNSESVRLQNGRRGRPPSSGGSWWQTEPDVGRVVNGVSRGLDSFVWKERIKSLGNAVVPQVAEKVGRLILEATR